MAVLEFLEGSRVLSSRVDIYFTLYLLGKVKPENIDPGDKLCLANYPLMTMFATATVEFNQKPVMPSNTLISYTSQIRALQEYDKDGMCIM